MGFMNAYKRLDNLCRDMNGIGVSGYIKDMDSIVNGSCFVSTWKADYSQLKHYRYIRNQIAHENYADESNMCSAQDTVWLENFYQRILTLRDPLALYYKTVKQNNTSKMKVSVTKIQPENLNASNYTDTDKLPVKRSAGCAVFALLMVIGIALIVLSFS